MSQTATPADTKTPNVETPDWYRYRGPQKDLPPSPPWRSHHDVTANDYAIPKADADDTFRPDPKDVAMVNAAIYLRRPLLVTGRPGSGKSSLARAIAHELGLGKVLVWPINSRSTLQEGLYTYDALARLQESSRLKPKKDGDPPMELPIGRYLRLGPLGTALLPRSKPRVLLVDEIDKSDIDLPNDLLHVFERGQFAIPELARAAKQQEKLSVMPFDSDEEIPLPAGEVQCREFPLVILTSNGERDFPPAFNRRCLRLEMELPNAERLTEIVEAHLKKATAKRPEEWETKVKDVIKHFLALRNDPKEMVATDQLLNALHFIHNGVDLLAEQNKGILNTVLRGLVSSSTQ
jgi:MoxR-like ATPase